MSVVGRLIPHRKFDEKIFLERVSKIIVVLKLTANQNFCDNDVINQQIKDKDWHISVTNDSPLSVNELLITIIENSGLDGAVADRLELSYKVFIGDKGNTKIIKLDDKSNIFDIRCRKKSTSY